MPTESTPESTPLPHRIAVLCYLYDSDGRVLMLHRAKAPNRHLYSPVGGKLETDQGESPWECARREIEEETGLRIEPEDIRLCGMVSETAYEASGHWLLFLFEVTQPIDPGALTITEFDEGQLEWIDPEAVMDLPIPETDRRVIWPLVCKHKGGFFGAHIDCRTDPFTWSLVQEGLLKA